MNIRTPSPGYSTPRNGSRIHQCLARTGAILALALWLPSVSAQTATSTPTFPTWSGSVAAGLSLTRGNSDTLLFTLSGRAVKKWQENELSLGLDASYGEDSGVKNNESLGGFGQYNRMVTDRWYGFVRAEALHDAIADVDYRVTLSVGAGYYLIKEKQTTLSLEAGPGYVIEKQGGEENDYFTVRLAEKFEHKFSDRARVWQSVEVLPQLDDFENFIVNSEVGAESVLTKGWSLRVVAQDTYDNEPAAGREKNDLKLISALVWKF